MSSSTDLVSPNSLSRQRRIFLYACESCKRRKKRCIHGNNRAISVQACEICKKRKVRCTHAALAESPSPDANDQVATSIPPRTATRRKTVDSGKNQLRASGASETQSTEPTSRSGADHDRFVGELNPESVFIEGDQSNVNMSENGNRIGVWVQKVPFTAHNSSLGTNGGLKQAQIGRHWILDPAMEKFLIPYLEERCYALVPSVSEFAHVIKIYQTKIYPWFPIFRSQELSQSTTPLRKMLVLFLVSRLHPNDSSLTSCNDLLSAIITLLDFRMLDDSLLLLQAYIIISFFAESLVGSTRALEYASIAHHYCLCRALHLDEKHADLEMVFFSLWIVDRLNTSLHGRAMLMHTRDIGRNLVVRISRQPPLFQLFLRLGLELDRVVDLYRPAGYPNRGSNILPPFEHLKVVSEVTEDNNNAAFLASLEVFYHALSILAQRQPHTDLSKRTPFIQLAISSADTIISLTKDCSRELLPLPIVPYAVSIAMSVAYRQLRTSANPAEQRLSAQRLHDTCEILERLGSYLSYSEIMVKVAKQFLSHIRLTSPELMIRDVPPVDITAETMPMPEQRAGECGGLELLEFDSDFSWDIFDSTFWSNMDPSLPTNFDGVADMSDKIFEP